MKKVYANDIEIIRSYMFFYFLISFLCFILIVISVNIKNFFLLFLGIVLECIVIYKIVINILKVKNYDEDKLYSIFDSENKNDNCEEVDEETIQKKDNNNIFNNYLNEYLQNNKKINFKFCPYCGNKVDENTDNCKNCGNRIPK